MSSADLQQNFILFLENKTKEAQKNHNRRLCCEKCRFSTKDIDLFERHVAHHEEVTFSCNLCNHISYSRVESQRHIVLHKGSFPYKCNWCSYGAVRRDYMVKHIQRIHGRSADGSLATDCALPATISEHLTQVRTDPMCPEPARASEGPYKWKNVPLINRSTGNVFTLLPSVNHPKVNAPHVAKPVHQITNNQPQLLGSTMTQSATSMTCILPVPKPHLRGILPHSEPSFSHAVNKVTLGVSSSPNVITEISQTECKTSETISRLPGKPTLSALPRVHVSVGADRTIQPKALQNQVGATTDKTVIQPKTIPKVQVGLPVGNGNHLKTLLSNPVEASGQKLLDIQNLATDPLVQKPVLSGMVRNIPVADAVQRTILSGAHPSTPIERCGQSAPLSPSSTLTSERIIQQRTLPNILVKPPSKNLRSSSQPKVQVELLAPLNQPLQHNKPLTVSCPEEITIPAGCLVELVEVKNVNGTKELELRLVPQQPNGPEPRISRNTMGADTSFTCKLDPDYIPQKGQNQWTNSTMTSGPIESQIKGSYLKEHCTSSTVSVKAEPVLNEGVLLSKTIHTPVAASLVGKSVLGSQLPFTGHKNVTDSTVLVQQMPRTGRNTYQTTNSRNFTTEQLRKAQPTTNKPDEVESSYKGLPVISSVFSLCPVPETSLNDDDAKGPILNRGVERIPLAPGTKINVKKSDKLMTHKVDLKKEEESGSFAESVKKSEDTTVPEGVVQQNISDVLLNSSQTFENGLKGNMVSELSRPLLDFQQQEVSGPTSSMIEQTASNRDYSQDKTFKEGYDKNLSINPKVALVRIPSLDFYSLLESAKKAPERIFGEESITARPVLCCKSNQQNRSIKLVLKRKRPDSENKDSNPQTVAHFDVLLPRKKHKKEKKRGKKHRSKLGIPDDKEEKGKLWLTPLKEDQPIKIPGPNQPVVVLNHPKPAVNMQKIDNQILKDDKCVDPAQVISTQQGAGPSFKMKLKKVQGQEYQVTELVLKSFF